MDGAAVASGAVVEVLGAAAPQEVVLEGEASEVEVLEVVELEAAGSNYNICVILIVKIVPYSLNLSLLE
jgi:hypothetical protein